MLNNLIESVLLIAVAFAVRALFAAIGVTLDEATFNAIVAGIVSWLLARLGLGLAVKAFPGAVKRGLLKEE